jgi:hypothetical protein
MENNVKMVTDVNTIDLGLAQSMCANWRTAFGNAFPQIAPLDVLRGFRIPIIDITELAAQHGAVAVRGYLAMEDPMDITTLKMLLVPIITNGTEEFDKIMDPEPIVPPQYYIYDFTRPCPVQCDVTSPLYGPVQS